MKTRRLLVLWNVGVASLVALAACDDPNSLLGGGRDGRTTDPTTSPQALLCTQKPNARSYKGFDDSKLEDTRANEAASANLARFKPFGVMAGEYQRVLGVVPPNLANASSSFDAPPDRWYAEPTQSAVSLSAAFDLSFQACTQALGSAEYGAIPTADSAKNICTSAMRKAWSRAPSPDELSACTELATEKLGAEPDPHRRWAYVCASILSSSNFLTY
jgi:hypothetical protein